MTENKTVLIILDGWGIGDKSKSDAIYNGNTPFYDNLLNKYPNSQLSTSGEDVGLPKGQMGNSEVGHLNIGAGRVVYQDLVKINKACIDNSISKSPELTNALEYASKNKKNVHFIGLVSDGGVHSSLDHLIKLCEITNNFKINNIFIHALTDGRDTDPYSGLGYIKTLINKIQNTKAKIATISGRYYGMDRDKRWERIKIAYDMLTKGIGEKTTEPLYKIEESYNNKISDEFIKPIICTDKSNKPIGLIQKDDVVICFNYRTDRLRQLTRVLFIEDFNEFDMNKIPLYFVTMTNYDENFKDIKVIFNKENVKNSLGEILSKNNKKQLRIAETEKYAHVTFFFSGGQEKEFKFEERILIDSPKIPTYDLKPEMSAYEVKNQLVNQINSKKFDFICVNYANGDMIGHTGVYNAILKATEVIDNCLKDTVNAAINNNYDCLIIADHGNADFAINPDNTPNTAHSTNPVPCILISKKFKNINNGKLADIAPTILKIMNLNIPPEMTGKALL